MFRYGRFLSWAVPIAGQDRFGLIQLAWTGLTLLNAHGQRPDSSVKLSWVEAGSGYVACPYLGIFVAHTYPAID